MGCEEETALQLPQSLPELIITQTLDHGAGQAGRRLWELSLAAGFHPYSSTAPKLTAQPIMNTPLAAFPGQSVGQRLLCSF